MNRDVADLRRDYARSELRRDSVDASPIHQFARWLNEALAAELPEPNAMTLATAGQDGKPHARVLLLKGFDDQGFVFYTNYLSAKGRELEHNPQAAMVFLWLALERQVRIEGTVSKVSQEQSELYFHSRPYGSQIGAVASHQSQPIASREELDQRAEQLQARYPEAPVPMPEHWGGYRLEPGVIEFWQGRTSRLHDRLRYERRDSGWHIDRLEP